MGKSKILTTKIFIINILEIITVCMSENVALKVKHETEGVLAVLKKLFSGSVMFALDGIRNTHKEGHVFILLGIILTLFAYSITTFLGNIFLVITVWCVCFFRDPERVIPQQSGIFVAPADGIITGVIENEYLPEELGVHSDEKFTRVSIFLNVFNVHVNRIPAKATVEKVCYVPGKFLNASIDKSSKENERNVLMLKTEEGETFAVTQIAGLIARRIVSYANQGTNYQRGERYGIIRFGSRVDVFVPKNYKVSVLLGQTMVGGETVIASK